MTVPECMVNIHYQFDFDGSKPSAGGTGTL